MNFFEGLFGKRAKGIVSSEDLLDDEQLTSMIARDLLKILARNLLEVDEKKLQLLPFIIAKMAIGYCGTSSKNEAHRFENLDTLNRCIKEGFEEVNDSMKKAGAYEEK